MAAGILLLKILCARTWKGRNHAIDLAMLEEDAKFAIARATVITDHTEILHALAREALNQIIGKSRAAKSAVDKRLSGKSVWLTASQATALTSARS